MPNPPVLICVEFFIGGIQKFSLKSMNIKLLCSAAKQHFAITYYWMDI